MMEETYRPMVNAHGLKALLKTPQDPNENLGIGDDDYRADVPLVIFTEQHLPAQRPVVPSPYSLPYEKTAIKGANDSLSMENFETDNFSLGLPFDSP